MHTCRIFHFRMLGVIVVTLILLVISGLVFFLSMTWSLLYRTSSHSPVQVDPLEVVSRFHSGVNGGDPDAILALFAKDATVEDCGSTIQGEEEVQDWILHSPRMTELQLSLVRSEAHDNRITWTDIAHDGTDAEGRAFLLRWVAVMEDGKIHSLSVSLLPMPDGK